MKPRPFIAWSFLQILTELSSCQALEVSWKYATAAAPASSSSEENFQIRRRHRVGAAWHGHGLCRARRFAATAARCPFARVQPCQNSSPSAGLLSLHGDLRLKAFPQGAGRAHDTKLLCMWLGWELGSPCAHVMVV